MPKLNQYNSIMSIAQCMIRSWMLNMGYYRCKRYNSQPYYADGKEISNALESRKDYIKHKRTTALRQPL